MTPPETTDSPGASEETASQDAGQGEDEFRPVTEDEVAAGLELETSKVHRLELDTGFQFSA